MNARKNIVISIIIVIVAMATVTVRSAEDVAWPASMNPIAQISIIGIDANTLYYLGNNRSDKEMYRGDFPIPRVWYSRLVQILREANAQVIAFDYVFMSVPPITTTDMKVAEAVAAGPPPVIVGFDLMPSRHAIEPNIDLSQFALPSIPSSVAAPSDNALALPYTELVKAGASLGAVTIVKDEDKAVRRGAVIVNNGTYTLPSMALQIFMKVERINPRNISVSGGGLNVGGVTIPLTRDNTLDVAIPPMGQVFPRYSLLDVVKPKDEFKSDSMEKHLELMKKEFEGRIVIIGPLDITLKDIWDTPAGRMYPGVEIIAATTNQLLNYWARARGIRKPVWEPDVREAGAQ